MAEDFAEHLILHRYIGLASHMIPELRLDHGEGALDIRPVLLTERSVVLVTNRLDWSAAQIIGLYLQRWPTELPPNHNRRVS
jgi:hypothetical protein